MKKDDMIDILRNVTGDARGIAADDLLLILYRRTEGSVFWDIFRQVLVDLWSKRQETSNDHALAAAADFIAGLSPEEKPDKPYNIAGFLLSGSDITPDKAKPEDWFGIASALRILTHLGLGDETSWRGQFRFWLDHGISNSSFLLSALEGLVQAVRGVVATGGMRVSDFARLFEAALRAPDFPSLEVYSALVEETIREREQGDFDPKRFSGYILKEFSDLRQGCNAMRYHSSQTDNLYEVISAWHVDELKLEPRVKRDPYVAKEDSNVPPWKGNVLRQYNVQNAYAGAVR